MSYIHRKCTLISPMTEEAGWFSVKVAAFAHSDYRILSERHGKY